MSSQDVDLEFEKAYQRLFGTSSQQDAGSKVERAAVPTPLPTSGSSKVPHRLPPAIAKAGPSKKPEQSRWAHHDATASLLSRQPSGSKSRPTAEAARSGQARATQRERPSQPKSPRLDLDALIRHTTASASKGKARAHSYLEPEQKPLKARKNAACSPTIPSVGIQGASMAPPEGGVVYYPYPHPQSAAQYQVPGPVMAPVPSQAITWTQPVMAAGPIPTITYPGFATAVTFSQPQFFASHPPQIQPAMSPVPANTWAATSSASVQPQSPQRAAAALPEPHRQAARSSPSSAMKKKLTFEQKRAAALARLFALDRKSRRDESGSAETADVRRWEASSSRAVAGPVKAKPKQKPWKPLLDKNGFRIPRKRGRPAKDVNLARIKSEDNLAQIKSEPSDAIQPWSNNASSSLADSFDGCFSLADSAPKPYRRETHTLLIDPSRRLRWLARLATTSDAPEVKNMRNAIVAGTQFIPWCRWGNSIAAQLHDLHVRRATGTDGSASQESPTATSQSDPAGLFPREKRKEYVAQRKQLHATARTATERMCICRLMRYSTKVTASAEAITEKEKQAYLDRKLRPAKLAKYMLRFAKPQGLDVRKIWCHWAKVAHAQTRRQVQGQKGRVSFAPTTEREAEVRVKMEPESPSKQQSMLSAPWPPAEEQIDRRQVKVKAEGEERLALLGTVTTPPLPIAPSGAVGERTSSPLFLKRNFRLYRLLGLSDLPRL